MQPTFKSMTFKRRLIANDQRESRLRMETPLRNTTCSKGHTHPPWNTTGILRIEKCESTCGFCQKETKTAANLRKHVAIHIKNERLNLTIAEGSSGRGRLEMPQPYERETSSSSSRVSHISDEMGRSGSSLASRQRSSKSSSSTDPFSPSAVLMSMHQPNAHAGASKASYLSTSSAASYPVSTTHTQAPSIGSYSYPYPSTPSHLAAQTHHSYSHQPQPHPSLYPYSDKDLFRGLREHNISTKTAWTVIPATEGTRILDLCKSMSVAQVVDSPVQDSRGSAIPPTAPCYHRETLYDEEWQAHLRDVHGVSFLWPNTWLRRIEVVDLEPYGGDIDGINNLIIDR